MRTIPTGRRLAVCGLSALAGLLLAAAPRPAIAAEGVVRISDRSSGVVQTSHSDACAPAACTTDACGEGCGSGCACGSDCRCKRGLLGKLFGKRSHDCRCGSGCNCGKGGSGLRLCGHHGTGRPVGNGYCSRCGGHGLLYGPGCCHHCCCLLGIPCCLPGIPVPGCLSHGAIGGCYGRVYALNPYYHDFRDGAVYAAQGYNAPIAVPLAPNVAYQWNYGWGIPSSRLTPVSRVIPSPYAPQPQWAVPPGYVPAGEVPPQADGEDE